MRSDHNQNRILLSEFPNIKKKKYNTRTSLYPVYCLGINWLHIVITKDMWNININCYCKGSKSDIAKLTGALPFSALPFSWGALPIGGRPRCCSIHINLRSMIFRQWCKCSNEWRTSSLCSCLSINVHPRINFICKYKSIVCKYWVKHSLVCLVAWI